MLSPSKLILSLVICAAAGISGPVDFGLSEFNAALASRNLKWKAKAELSLDPPETYRIEPYTAGGAHITGGDLRGLMYGLLEAAEQVRANGKLALSHGVPANAMRGIRLFVHPSDLAKYPESTWRSYFQLLARVRFNRVNLVLLNPTPYPFLMTVEAYPGIRQPGVTGDQRDRNLRMLRSISQGAADYGIDFILGIWDAPGDVPAEGITRTNQGRYTHEALRKLLASCPMIRGIQLQADSENVAVYRDSIFRALHEAGRRVTLDLRGSLRQPAMLKAAQDIGVALQLSSTPWPGGFEIDPPLWPSHWDLAHHQQYYWLWGRFGYDPKTKPPKAEDPEDYRAAAQLIGLLTSSHFADPNMYTWPGANPGVYALADKNARAEDWGAIAGVSEAVRNRLNHIPSAKQTPLQTADLLLSASMGLRKASAPDLRILEQLAQYHAHKQVAGYHLELFDQSKDAPSLERAENELKSAQSAWNAVESLATANDEPQDLMDIRLEMDAIAQRRRGQGTGPPLEVPQIAKLPPRPQVTHAAAKTAVPDHPITLTLQIAVPKDLRTVRLHYRSTNPTVPPKALEQPAATSITFTIPGTDVDANWDILYYFEILNRDNTGWFEPDAFGVAPYMAIHVNAPIPQAP